MGMAHHAPFDTYKPRYLITDDAVVSMRRSMAVGTHEHLPPKAIEMKVDQAVSESVDLGNYEKVIDNSGPDPVEALLVKLPDHVVKDHYALVKSDKMKRKDKSGSTMQAVILILTKAMVETSKRNRRWSVPGASAPGKLGKLGSLMPKDVMSRVVDSAAKKAAEEVNKTKWRVLYEDEDGKTVGEDVIYEEKSAALEEYARLYEEGGGEGLRLEKEILVPKWEKVSVKVRIDAD